MHPADSSQERLFNGLAVAGCVALLMAIVAVIFGGCWLVGAAYQRSHVLGWVGGIFAILVFFFVIGATADWSDF